MYKKMQGDAAEMWGDSPGEVDLAQPRAVQRWQHERGAERERERAEEGRALAAGGDGLVSEAGAVGADEGGEARPADLGGGEAGRARDVQPLQVRRVGACVRQPAV